VIDRIELSCETCPCGPGIHCLGCVVPVLLPDSEAEAIYRDAEDAILANGEVQA
jgi:hypothetical protein